MLTINMKMWGKNSGDDYDCEEDDGDMKTLVVTSGGISVAGRQRS